MTLTIIIGALAACGIILIIWTVVEALFLPLPREGAYIVLFLSGDIGKIQQKIRACRWFRECKGLGAKLILVDDGLSPDAQSAVELLIRGEDSVILCSRMQLPEYFETEK